MVWVMYLEVKKLKKINVRLILIQCVFLCIVVGGSILLYNFLGPYFYRMYRINLLTEAFEALKDVDLADVDEDMEKIIGYESYNFIFIIADEEFNPVYPKYPSTESSVYKNIQIRIQDFSTKPRIIRRKNNNTENIRILGIIKQGDSKYYVCIRDRIRSVDDSFEFTVVILGVIFLAALAIGSAIMYFMSNGLSKPIQQLELVAQKIAKRDFSQKAEENGKFEELNSLACSINSMADQIQEYIHNVEENKEKLVQQNMQQEHMAKARKDFVSNVSHELKTPLAVISSQVEMLEYLTDKKERDYYCASIQEEIARMSEIVGNLLDITAIEHDMGKMERKKISLNETISYILLKYDALFQRKGIKVETELEEDCIVYGDKDYMEQAVSNFVMNAFQHTESGKKIKITMEKKIEDVCVRVYNQGEPVAEEEMGKIWKSFYVPEQEKEREEENGLGHTGLGLYIVKCVIKMHGGEYGVRNVDEGVEFWFSIPAFGKKETVC